MFCKPFFKCRSGGTTENLSRSNSIEVFSYGSGEAFQVTWGIEVARPLLFFRCEEDGLYLLLEFFLAAGADRDDWLAFERNVKYCRD